MEFPYISSFAKQNLSKQFETLNPFILRKTME